MRQLRQKFWVGVVCLAALTSCGGGNGTGEMPPPGGPPVITTGITPASSYPVNAPISVQMPPPTVGSIEVPISKGQTLTLTVTVSGEEPMGYTWTYVNRVNPANNRTWTDIGSRLTISDIQPEAHNGKYTVTIANRAGYAGSAPVFVVVK